MKTKTTLSDVELIEAVGDWNTKLCKSGGRAWSLCVPVNFNRDPDMLISELIKRFQNPWQDVNDAIFPNKDEEVIVYDAEYKKQMFAEYIKAEDYFYWIETFECKPLHKVTHWRPKTANPI